MEPPAPGEAITTFSRRFSRVSPPSPSSPPPLSLQCPALELWFPADGAWWKGSGRDPADRRASSPSPLSRTDTQPGQSGTIQRQFWLFPLSTRPASPNDCRARPSFISPLCRPWWPSVWWCGRCIGIHTTPNHLRWMSGRYKIFRRRRPSMT